MLGRECCLALTKIQRQQDVEDDNLHELAVLQSLVEVADKVEDEAVVVETGSAHGTGEREPTYKVTAAMMVKTLAATINPDASK